ILSHYLQSHYPQPFTFLDLGCGDASFSRRLFEQNIPLAYTAVDLSATALGLARQNFQGVSFVVNFHHQELSAFLATNPQRFDVILSSFSVHHLDSDQKQKYLRQVYQHLNPQGVLLFVDIFRPEGEDRLTYLQRYANNIQQYWTALSTATQNALIDHILASDYPETEFSFGEWGRKAGFSQIESIYTGGRDTQKILALR
ncbi:MAG: class I SAM-dependent methyltransferase, partial [Microcystaceae cyanobacterium]